MSGRGRAVEVGEHELSASEAEAGHEDSGQDLHGALEAAHHDAEPEGHDHSKDGELTSGHLTEQVGVDAGHAGGGQDGSTDGTEGHGSSVGDKAEASAVKGIEAKAGKHGGGDGNGGTETGSTFKEGTEGKGDEDSLEATVRSHTGQGVLDDLELAGFHGHVVHPHGRDNDPDNRTQAGL